MINFKRIFLGFCLLACTSIAFMSLRYFTFSMVGVLALHTERLVDQTWFKLFFYAHVAGGIVALTTSPWQLMKVMKWHKLVGRVYFYGAVVAAATGLVVGFVAVGGWTARIGFIVASSLWFFFTIRGVQAIRSGNLSEHRRWILRSFAMTFLAVSFRIWLLMYPVFGLTFTQGYQISAWTWVVNLLVVEIYAKRMAERSRERLVLE